MNGDVSKSLVYELYCFRVYSCYVPIGRSVWNLPKRNQIQSNRTKLTPIQSLSLSLSLIFLPLFQFTQFTPTIHSTYTICPTSIMSEWTPILWIDILMCLTHLLIQVGRWVSPTNWSQINKKECRRDESRKSILNYVGSNHAWKMFRFLSNVCIGMLASFVVVVMRLIPLPLIWLWMNPFHSVWPTLISVNFEQDSLHLALGWCRSCCRFHYVAYDVQPCVMLWCCWM